MKNQLRASRPLNLQSCCEGMARTLNFRTELRTFHFCLVWRVNSQYSFHQCLQYDSISLSSKISGLTTVAVAKYCQLTPRVWNGPKLRKCAVVRVVGSTGSELYTENARKFIIYSICVKRVLNSLHGGSVSPITRFKCDFILMILIGFLLLIPDTI